MKKYLLLTVLVMLLAAIGCRFGQPVGSFAYDFPSAEASKNISEKKMHDAIVKGCNDSGWRVSEPASNTIEATIMVRNKHTVVVSIPIRQHITASTTRPAQIWNTRPRAMALRPFTPITTNGLAFSTRTSAGM